MIQNFDDISESAVSQGLKRMDGKMLIKVNMDEIQKWSSRLAFSVMFFGLFAYLRLWEISDSTAILGDIHESFFQWLGALLLVTALFALSFVIGSLVHELIHAAFFLPFLPSGMKGLTFGYLKDKMVLYVHLKEPISVTGFRIGVIMPAIILGFFPIIFGLLYGYLSALLFGILLTVAAVGDLLLLVKTRHLHSGYMIKDQPDDIAVIAVEKSKPRQIVS